MKAKLGPIALDPGERARIVAEVALVHRGERPAPRECDLESVAAFFCDWIGPESAECLAVLALGNRGEPLACEIVARGGLGSVAMDPRTVFRSAVYLGASALYVSHNHPSGDPSPSDADVRCTGALIDAGGLLGIEVLDHVVCTAGARWCSIRETVEARAGELAAAERSGGAPAGGAFAIEVTPAQLAAIQRDPKALERLLRVLAAKGGRR